ncbi:hypothetical protein GCM10009837_05720 [Streptomyces durmitorensis]|uniref:Response regulatory domain-containing protein n=1 Tax=Streptomyces durmitorensis TaxID=319947 RepID=A0ABY4PL59_9ACTN|nr:hypothetical protein [Streptomyces durmitorensis]UQT54527.1 hypothetical protein M4V62_05110 [Streptomyces durmitorensis]
MLTVLVLAADHRARDLIPQIESVPGVYVISQTDDSFLALARARALLPDVLVIDLSARFAGDAATVIDQARQLQPPSHILVHSGDFVVGTVSPAGAVGTAPAGAPPGLAHELARLAGDVAPPQ